MGAGADLICYLEGVGVNLGKFANLQSHAEPGGKQPRTLTRSPVENVETLISLTCIFLDYRRKLQYLKKTHTDPENTIQKDLSLRI